MCRGRIGASGYRSFSATKGLPAGAIQVVRSFRGCWVRIVKRRSLPSRLSCFSKKQSRTRKGAVEGTEADCRSRRLRRQADQSNRERPHLSDRGDGAQTRRRLPNNPGILAQRPESRGPLRGLGPHLETPPTPAQGPIVHQRIASYPLISGVRGVSDRTGKGSLFGLCPYFLSIGFSLNKYSAPPLTAGASGLWRTNKPLSPSSLVI